MKHYIDIIWSEREWLFSGIGVSVLAALGTGCWIIIRKVIGKNRDLASRKKNDLFPKVHDEMKNAQNINGSFQVTGNGNIIGNGNDVINYNIYSESFEHLASNAKSWFSERYDNFIMMMNNAKRSDEEEYTVEHISSLMGLKSVNELKIYLTSNKEPDDDFKQKFVDTFGVNKEWMLHGRGKYPFASNIIFPSNDPMDILRKENLTMIEKLIVVVGRVEGNGSACIIRKKNEVCYEIYPKRFILTSKVGGDGSEKLIEFYRFLRESDRINKLDNTIYYATENQMKEILNGACAPKMVENFKIARNFMSDFMCLDHDEIEKNRKVWGKEFSEIQTIIVSRIDKIDRNNQEYDEEIITKNLGKEYVYEKNNDIDQFNDSEVFFSYRFGKAFPGIRGLKEFTDSKECIQRLQILLREPLEGKKLGNPIWWFRGGENFNIKHFEVISDSKFMMDCQEVKVKRIIAYAADSYYRKFVYVEAYPEEKTGLYQYDQKHIEEWVEAHGYYNEEYAEYHDKKITIEEYDDGAAEINGHIVDIEENAKLRMRYITPYNFIICGKFNPINNSHYDDKMGKLLNGILKGTNSVEEMVEFVDQMPKI